MITLAATCTGKSFVFTCITPQAAVKYVSIFMVTLRKSCCWTFAALVQA